MKAYHINSAEQTVTEVEYYGLEDLQTLVGGYIECAYRYPNGDVLYVDEEGLFKQVDHWFAIPERTDQPFAGNGVLVGPERGPDTVETFDPVHTVEQLRRKVAFPIIPAWRA